MAWDWSVGWLHCARPHHPAHRAAHKSKFGGRGIVAALISVPLGAMVVIATSPLLPTFQTCGEPNGPNGSVGQILPSSHVSVSPALVRHQLFNLQLGLIHRGLVATVMVRPDWLLALGFTHLQSLR